ncbi:MAG: FAD-dependent oxidoreductase [Sulfurospirillaceae bacterium]|nr:FAD-dependent oxidoreductase [Sulfurospirillaceae bacterium]MCK9545288.1 FAD-dependent oxidoreductase [Sulfurospirillaceae bacterium]MDY0237347.1 FAD-dependent oxidoreductase [Campylobacterales bacterium]NLM98798.1 FAD-dependent oxidoreductase [Campylobacteraceae bacterium]
MSKKHYEVIVVGGGISGAALFYELARYTDINSIALLEKYEALSTLNSKGTSNSQTIHFGDIETNYTAEKAAKVKYTADMVVKYCLQHGYENDFLFSHQKMAIGVGEEEVAYMRKRYEDFKEIFPYLEVYEKDKLKEIEPKLIYDSCGNERPEEIVGVGVQGEYSTVDFGKMSESLVENAKKEKGKTTDVFFNSQVVKIEKKDDGHELTTKDGRVFSASYVVVNAGAHSLYLAHKMGHGLEFGCLPVAGSFYLTTKKILNGKVYMVQNPKLPFAALHGDPDILADGFTRFGPTALVLPKLERYHGNSTIVDFFKTLQFDKNIAIIFKDLLKDRTIRNYVFRNFLFEIPYFNKKLFLKDARKIVPSLELEDIRYATGFGGVRPQVLNKKERKLMLGEASVTPGTGIVFNMTPSPGATSCLGNAYKDSKAACEYLGKTFNEDMFKAELVD